MSSKGGRKGKDWFGVPVESVPDQFKPAMQLLSKALNESQDEIFRLQQENENLRTESQSLADMNKQLEQQKQSLEEQLRRAASKPQPPPGRAPAPAAPAVQSRPAAQPGQSRFEEIRLLENHREPVHTVAVKDDDLVATGSWDKTVQLYSLEKNTVVKKFGGAVSGQQEMGGLYSVAFAKTHPDMLACTSADNKVYIWDFKEQVQKHVLSGHKDEVNSVSFHEKQHVICTASDDKKAMIWDFMEGMPLRTLDKHNAAVYGATFLGEAMQYNVATCCLTNSDSGKASFCVFDMRDKKEIVQRSDHTDDIIGIDFCAQQNLLATGSDDGFIRLYDLRTWSSAFVINTNEVQSLQSSESTNEVKRISFSPDGTMLAAAGSNKSVLIYSKKDGTWALTEELKGHEDCVFDVSWSKGGTFLASASHDKKSRIWKMTY